MNYVHLQLSKNLKLSSLSILHTCLGIVFSYLVSKITFSLQTWNDKIYY